MHFFYGLLTGGFIVFAIYHWGLQPMLRKERDDLLVRFGLKKKNEP